MSRTSGPFMAYGANTTVPGGNTVSNTVAETIFASKYTLTPNTLAVGTVLRVTAFGIYGTDTISAGTVTFKLKAGNTTLATTGALVNVISLTNRGWMMRCLCVVTAIGAGGTIEAQGNANLSTALSTSLAANLANTAAISVDTTAAIDIGCSVQFSIANANNTATMRVLLVERLG